MTITEFLLARIAEREAAAKEAMAPDWMGEKKFYKGVGGHRDDWGLWTFNVPPEVALAECEAQRAAIDAAWGDHCRIEGEWGHPDFQDEWSDA